VIITSRWLGYKAQRLRDAGFRHFILQDLEIEQIQEFIERWHELFTDQLDNLRKKERLIKAIQDSKAIRELAGNPLLLTMMAILNRNQELPRDRPELYNQASRVLLHQWDVERFLIEDARIDPKTFDYRNKQAMLRKVAYRMQSSEQGLAGNLISESALREEITRYLQQETDFDKPKEIAQVLIHQLRTRNFILCDLGADSYGFVHRTFLEYFCAWEFVWQFEKERTLTIEQLINDVFGAHWQDESWHEVLRLICGMIEPKFVAEIIDFLLEQKVDRSKFLDEDERVTKEGLDNLILAANCFAEARNRNLIATTSEKLLKILKSEIEQEDEPWFHPDLAEVLVSLIVTSWADHPHTLSWLKDCLNCDSSSYVPEFAINAITEVWKEDSDTLPLLKSLVLLDENRYVRRAAVTAIAQGWKEDPDTLPLLKDRALQDEDEDVRYVAVNAIAQFWKEDPDTLPWLKDRVLQDEHFAVRQTAVKAIAQFWKEDPDTLPWLKDRALHDENWNVRQAALKAIAKGWEKYPDTLSFLKGRALQDENWSVRRAAVYAIIKGWKEDPDTLVEVISQNWKEDPDTLPLLKDRALQDEDNDVRRTAVYSIAESWKEDPDTLLFLKDCALQNKNYAVRQAAVRAIAQGWKEDPDTLPLLKDRALHDENRDVRGGAVKAIIENGQEDSELFEFLGNIALNDPFKREYDWENNPRQTALEALLENFSDTPKTLEILNQVSLNDSDEELRDFAVEKLREREMGGLGD